MQHTLHDDIDLVLYRAFVCWFGWFMYVSVSASAFSELLASVSELPALVSELPAPVSEMPAPPAAEIDVPHVTGSPEPTPPSPITYEYGEGRWSGGGGRWSA